MKHLGLILLALILCVDVASAADICEQHDFGWDRQTDIDFKGWSWDFEAENEMVLTSIEANSRIAAWDGTLTIQVKVNTIIVAEWEHYIQDIYYNYYLDRKNVNVRINTGDIITYFIYSSSGGPGGTRGDNYLKLCGDAVQSKVTINSLGLNVSSTPQPGGMVIFTAGAKNSEDEDVFYRYDIIPNFGTAAYDPVSGWEMIQDFSTTNVASYRFPEAGSYILVAWASPIPAIQPGAAPIIGGSITVGGDQPVMLKGLKTNFTDNPKVGQIVKLTATAVNNSGGEIYYRFDLIPNYGLATYDPDNHWETIQNFSTIDTTTHTFTKAGSYIVVVWASATKKIPQGAAPMFGCSITVE